MRMRIHNTYMHIQNIYIYAYVVFSSLHIIALVAGTAPQIAVVDLPLYEICIPQLLPPCHQPGVTLSYEHKPDLLF